MTISGPAPLHTQARGSGGASIIKEGTDSDMTRDPVVSQTDQTRWATEGRLVNSGGICTVILIEEKDGWVFHPHGVTGMAVRITGPDATKMATTILGASSESANPDPRGPHARRSQ